MRRTYSHFLSSLAMVPPPRPPGYLALSFWRSGKGLWIFNNLSEDQFYGSLFHSRNFLKGSLGIVHLDVYRILTFRALQHAEELRPSPTLC